ncbi:hypothetical protein BABINDRAFT_161113 [Babjeviella inositovora NRRL Y-12698]|uniref:Uncharacterized protein n=1 Tax=Babjeviella inositovora NRRL Y-12698 TaxID=984486 RepID=A0A1E3QQY7_9ASCO|nr:uncharacterized protein BABINDRAFT_161113 [Babjeviella inositovora NRRL Y-12698]ODQ80126.1 hypothetical protein BABINDRAFT_161113 [Babjeviella inositovora NRRL Y-12698]
MSLSLIFEARALLQQHNPQQALELLKPHLEEFKDNTQYLTILAEALMECSDLESAYEVLTRAVELDPRAETGTEKFFYLGQIIGSQEGLRLLKVGIEQLHAKLEIAKSNPAAASTDSFILDLLVSHHSIEAVTAYMVSKINHALLSCIEIWMTDLCMEDEAETECETLIQYALAFQPENPENWSTLGSIRISQQRNDDAREALTKAWHLFDEKKTQLEGSANSSSAGDSDVDYTDLIQPLLALSHHLLNIFELALASSASSAVQDIDDSNLESYYLEAFACYLQVKQQKFVAMASEEQAKYENDFQSLSIDLAADSQSDELALLLKQSRTALVAGWKLCQSDAVDMEDPDVAELGQQIVALLEETGGKVKMSEMRDEKFEVEEGWENEIDMNDS